MEKALNILVVDDNDLMITTIVAGLGKLEGVKILQASNGFDALKILDDYGKSTCVMITDHDMGGMTGDELIAKAKEKFPKIKSILISGRLIQKDVDEMAEPSKPTYFLAKPFSLPTLNIIVIRLLTDYVCGE